MLRYLLFAAFLCLAPSVNADFSSPQTWLEAAQEMCSVMPAECAPYKKGDPAVLKMSDRLFSKLTVANIVVNTVIKYKTDKDHYGARDLWRYPTDGYGDCEDFALEKRRRLIEVWGIPRRAMLLAIVKPHHSPKGTPADEFHMVLLVRTTAGYFVLDNMQEKVLPLKKADFDLRVIQSQADPNKWVYR